MSNDKLAEIIRSLGYTTQRQTAEIVAAIRTHEAEKQAGPVAIQGSAVGADDSPPTCTALSDSDEARAYADGWNECRAAVLSARWPSGCVPTSVLTPDQVDDLIKQHTGGFIGGMHFVHLCRAVEHAVLRASPPPVQNTAPPSPLTEQDKEDAELWRWVAWNCLSVTTIGADKIAATADAIRAARAKKEQP